MDIYQSPLAPMHINLQSVVNSGYPAVIRAAASKLMTRDYWDVGSFLKELPQLDLDELSTWCQRVIAGTDTDADFDCLILLACMLCQAEGGAMDGTTQSRTSNLIILLSFEELARKNVIDFHREKATLCTEFLDETLATLK